jgi:hypothetical protein
MWVCHPFACFADPSLAFPASNLNGMLWVNLCVFRHERPAIWVRTKYSILPRDRVLEDSFDEPRLLVPAEDIFNERSGDWSATTLGRHFGFVFHCLEDEDTEAGFTVRM